MDAGDGGEDGEDEDGRGGGRRKRTQNVMGNIRNYDIDQLDAQAKNRRNSCFTFSFIFLFWILWLFKLSCRRAERKREEGDRHGNPHRNTSRSLLRSRVLFRAGTRPIGTGYPGVTNPRDVGSFATTSRSSVNTLAVVPETNKKERNKAENKEEILRLVLARRPFRGYAC